MKQIIFIVYEDKLIIMTLEKSILKKWMLTFYMILVDNNVINLLIEYNEPYIFEN